MSEEVIFTISKDGQSIKAEANGVVGSGCLEMVEKFTKGLGEKVDEGRKPEYDLASHGGVRVGN